jgi:hypothetical protein
MQPHWFMMGIATVYGFCPKDFSFDDIFPFGIAFIGQMISCDI